MSEPVRLHSGSRNVDIWIPEDDFTGSRPLLVMHDGQNVFRDEDAGFGHSWRVREAVESLRGLGKPLPVVVGAWNSGFTRAAEYAPQDVLESNPAEPYGFLGDQQQAPLLGNNYQAELIEKVIPLAKEVADISSDRAHVAVGGSSMGGLASLYALTQFPETYGTALCVSTHWSMSTSRAWRSFVEQLPSPSEGHRIWFDHGTEFIDTEYGAKQAEINVELSRRGWAWPQVESRTYVGTAHNEQEWEVRLPVILKWWLEGLEF